MVGEGWRERKAIETIHFLSAISLLSPGSSWKVLTWLGTLTPWHAWTLSREGQRSPWWLLHSGALLFSVSYWQMQKRKCVNMTSLWTKWGNTHSHGGPLAIYADWSTFISAGSWTAWYSYVVCFLCQMPSLLWSCMPYLCMFIIAGHVHTDIHMYRE